MIPLLLRLKNREAELEAARKRNVDRLFAEIEAMIKWLGELKQLLNDNQVTSMLNINPIIEIIRVCELLFIQIPTISLRIYACIRKNNKNGDFQQSFGFIYK